MFRGTANCDIITEPITEFRTECLCKIQILIDLNCCHDMDALSITADLEARDQGGM